MLHPLLQHAARAGLGEVPVATVASVPAGSTVVVQPAPPRAIWPWVLGIAAAAAASFYLGSEHGEKKTRGDQYLDEYEAQAKRARAWTTY